jgi:hypothetical protein
MRAILVALFLVGCDGGAVGLSEEEMVCPKNGLALFDGFGPAVSTYQESEGYMEGPLSWEAFDDVIGVHCTPEMTVYLVR